MRPWHHQFTTLHVYIAVPRKVYLKLANDALAELIFHYSLSVPPLISTIFFFFFISLSIKFDLNLAWTFPFKGVVQL